MVSQSVGRPKMLILSAKTFLNWAMGYIAFTRVNPALRQRLTSKQMSSYVYRYSKMQTLPNIELNKMYIHRLIE